MGCPSFVIIGNNLTFTVCTHDPDTGVLTDADSAPSYRVYEDETGTAIATGTMAKLDDGSTTGFYSEQLACTSGNGYEHGKSYNIYISATVDSDTGGMSYAFTAYDYLTANTTLIEGSDATDQIRDSVVDDATRIDASALNTLSGHSPDNTIADIDNVTTIEGNQVTLNNGHNNMAGPGAGATFDSDTDSLEAIRNRLDALMGAITASGDNTVLGLFKALLNKAANTPSDVGGTFDPSTDSTEAVSEFVSGIKGDTWSSSTDTLEDIRNAIDGLEGVDQPGAIQETIYVAAGGQPLADVDVWATLDEEGDTVLDADRTDQNGNAYLDLDAGTVYIWVQKTGYGLSGSNPTEHTVS